MKRVTKLDLRDCGMRSVTIWMCDLPLPRTMEDNCWLRLCSTGLDKNCLRQSYGLERKIIPNFVGVSNPFSRCMTCLFQPTSFRDPTVISAPHSRTWEQKVTIAQMCFACTEDFGAPKLTLITYGSKIAAGWSTDGWRFGWFSRIEPVKWEVLQVAVLAPNTREPN